MDCIKQVVYNLVKVLKVGHSRIKRIEMGAFKIILIVKYNCFALTLDF